MTKAIDWAAIELDYRAGIKTLRTIGAEHHITHGAIRKRASRDGWTQDLSARIREKAQEKVSKSAVSKSVSKERAATDTQVIEANATLQSSIILGHREDIQAMRSTVASMAAELGAASSTDLQEALDLVLEEKVADLSNQQAKTALYKAFGAAMALGSRAGAGRNLVSALATLIDKERQAFGIDKEGGDRKSLGEWLEQLQ